MMCKEYVREEICGAQTEPDLQAIVEACPELVWPSSSGTVGEARELLLEQLESLECEECEGLIE